MYDDAVGQSHGLCFLAAEDVCLNHLVGADIDKSHLDGVALCLVAPCSTDVVQGVAYDAHRRNRNIDGASYNVVLHPVQA